MRLARKIKPILDHHVDCFGEFNPEDEICKKFCALRIRCVIENEQATRMEILEDLFFTESTNAKMQ